MRRVLQVLRDQLGDRAYRDHVVSKVTEVKMDHPVRRAYAEWTDCQASPEPQVTSAMLDRPGIQGFLE